MGDFNRHDQLWGGNRVATQTRQGEAEPVLLLMAEWGLNSILPRGTITYEEGSRRSTIDLVLASTPLSQRVTRCGIHPVEHGSDHQAIITTLQFNGQAAPSLKAHYLFHDTPWAKVNNQLRDLQNEIVDITNCSNLESAVGYLTEKVSLAVHQLVPIAKPSPYSKQWWTPELTVL